jgi:uncharacterized membrane protein
MEMNKIDKTITVNAPVHAIFEYIREPLNLPKLCSKLIAVEDIRRLPNGDKNFDWEYKMVNVHFFGTSNVTECDVNRRLVSIIQGGITGTITWLFQPENGWTHVTLIVEYALPLLFVQKHGENAIARENEAGVDSLLAMLKTTMEKAAGKIMTVDEAKTI